MNASEIKRENDGSIIGMGEFQTKWANFGTDLPTIIVQRFFPAALQRCINHWALANFRQNGRISGLIYHASSWVDRSISSLVGRFNGSQGWFLTFRIRCNDPSAGSPTETLLRLLLPLNDQV
jgi:hypothetical protein